MPAGADTEEQEARDQGRRAGRRPRRGRWRRVRVVDRGRFRDRLGIDRQRRAHHRRADRAPSPAWLAGWPGQTLSRQRSHNPNSGPVLRRAGVTVEHRFGRAGRGASAARATPPTTPSPGPTTRQRRGSVPATQRLERRARSAFNNKATNQDACKGATVNLAYSDVN